MRTADLKRTTAETDIALTLNLDGTGKADVNTGVGFLDHMLTLFARHGRFDLSVTCKGDVDVDFHHTTEDVGIVLGQAVQQCLGDKKGVVRYGSMLLPMDEALILTAIDLSGRSCLVYDLVLLAKKVGAFDTELVEEFFLSFVRNCPCALHIKQLDGTNTHHIIEGAFKAFGRSLASAVRIDEAYRDEVPSTKGVL